MDTDADFAAFESVTPPDVAGDPIWRLPAYRISRYLALAVRRDTPVVLAANPRSHVVPELERTIDSIGMNITEGYGRLHGRERARFYEFALGSAREARDWYVRATPPLEPGLVAARTELLSRVVKILTAAVPEERNGSSERRIQAALDRRRGKRKPMSRPESKTKSKPEHGRDPEPNT